MNFHKIFFFILILFFCSCKKRNQLQVKVFGHAGNGMELQSSIYHDNSKEAIELALSMEGCDGVELDVQLSKDNKLWLYHDLDLSSETIGKGCINSYNSSDLYKVNYRSIHKESLCSLSDINFQYLKRKTLFLDLRHYNSCEESEVNLDSLIKSINEYSILKEELIQVFFVVSNSNWIKPLTLNGHQVLASLNSFEEYSSIIDDEYLSGVMIKQKWVSKENVDYLHDLGKKVFIFDIRAPKETRNAIRKGADGIITDDLKTAILERNHG